MGGLTTPKGGATKETTSTQAPSPIASAAQQNLQNAANGVLGGYIAQPSYTTAGVNADQSGAFDLTRYLAQGAFTPTNNNLSSNPGYSPTYMGNGQGYAPAQTGGPATYDPRIAGNAQNYTAGQAGNAQTYGAASTQAARLGGSDYTEFMNPFIQGVIDPAVNNLRRQSDTNAAQIAAQGAAAGSRGGSAEALRQGQNTRALGEQTSQMVSQLISAGFDRATAAAMSNAQMEQQTRQSNQAAENAARQTNTSAQNQFRLSDVAAQNAAGQFNAGANNSMAQYNSGAINQAAQYNAGAANTDRQANAGYANTAAQFGANANNTAAQFNAGASNTAGQFNATQGMNFAQLQDALNSSDQTRKMQAIQMLYGMGTAQRTMVQDNLNEPLKYLQMLAQMTPQNYGSTTTGTSPNTAASPLQSLIGLGGSLLTAPVTGGGSLFSSLIK